VYAYVIGSLIRFIRIDSKASKETERVKIVKTMAHGFDGVSALEGNPYRDVYAIAEKAFKPRVFVYRLEKGRSEPKIMSKLTGQLNSRS
jgi:hypothetical protein